MCNLYYTAFPRFVKSAARIFSFPAAVFALPSRSPPASPSASRRPARFIRCRTIPRILPRPAGCPTGHAACEILSLRARQPRRPVFLPSSSSRATPSLTRAFLGHARVFHPLIPHPPATPPCFPSLVVLPRRSPCAAARSRAPLSTLRSPYAALLACAHLLPLPRPPVRTRPFAPRLSPSSPCRSLVHSPFPPMSPPAVLVSPLSLSATTGCGEGNQKEVVQPCGNWYTKCSERRTRQRAAGVPLSTPCL